MSTRSNIGIQNADGSISFIYCHFDGYPSNNGQLLWDHYQAAEKVVALVALGDLSSLGERVNPIGSHSYANSETGTTVAYGRDRGETGTETRTAEDRDGMNKQEYAYLCLGDGEWLASDHQGPWVPLADLIAANRD
jgi:hypothetical protein